jgi:hypothetical protein
VPPGYGLKSNLPDNFDPLIGSRKTPASLSASRPLAAASAPVPSAHGVFSPSSERFFSLPPISEPASPFQAESPQESTPPSRPSSPSQPVSSAHSPPPPVMAVGAFPPLSSLREIREFDGSAGKFIDFLASVEGHLSVYNLPILHGGYVSGDVDEGWEYASTIAYAANPPTSSSITTLQPAFVSSSPNDSPGPQENGGFTVNKLKLPRPLPIAGALRPTVLLPWQRNSHSGG